MSLAFSAPPRTGLPKELEMKEQLSAQAAAFEGEKIMTEPKVRTPPSLIFTPPRALIDMHCVMLSVFSLRPDQGVHGRTARDAQGRAGIFDG